MVKPWAMGAKAYRRNRAALVFSDDFSALSRRNVRPSGANKIRNSAMSGAVPGSPGLEPENMAVFPTVGLSSAVAGVGNVTAGGASVRNTDIRFYGTASAEEAHYIVMDSPGDEAPPPDPLYATLSGIPAGSGETWIFSVWLAMIGTATGFSQVSIALEIYDISGNWLDATFTECAVTSTLTRFSSSPLTVPGAGRFLKVTLLAWAAQGTVDFTLRVAGPDLRQGTTAGTHAVTTADSGNWNTRTHEGPDTVVRGQQQHYVDTSARDTIMSGGANPFSVSGGVLSITGSATPGGAATSRPYVSGVLTTRRKFSFQYGYAEASMRFPSGQGLWPQFRLLPRDKTAASDAAEIVVAEWPGGTDATLYARSITGTAPGTATTRTRATTVATMTGGQHLYGVHWTEDTIQFYFDRVAFGAAVTTPADLKRHLYLFLGLALGGDFPGAVSNTGQIPAALQVDGVSVWDSLPF